MLSRRLNNFDSSAIRNAFIQSAAIKDAVDFSIGYPIENTPEPIKQAGIEAIKKNHTRYTPTNGIPELRKALSKKLLSRNNIQVTPAEVSVTPGITTAILLVYLTLLDPDDEVLVPDPYFPPYVSLASMLGAKAVLVDTYPDFQLTVEKLEPLISPQTKAIVINSPNNPTGAVYPEAELRKIADLAEKHGLTLISDEIYEFFNYETPHFSVGSVYPQTITLNGFSKGYAMTGWRLGYLAGPTDIVAAVNELQQYIVFSSTSISQYAALTALDTDPEALARKYQPKRDLVRSALGQIAPLQGCQGAFYAFIQTPKGISDLDFMRQALEEKLIILPGSAFSARKDYVRIAYVADQPQLGRGLEIIKRLYK